MLPMRGSWGLQLPAVCIAAAYVLIEPVYTCYCLQLVLSTHVVVCTCSCLHMLLSAHVIVYTCYYLHVMFLLFVMLHYSSMCFVTAWSPLFVLCQPLCKCNSRDLEENNHKCPLWSYTCSGVNKESPSAAEMMLQGMCETGKGAWTAITAHHTPHLCLRAQDLPRAVLQGLSRGQSLDSP